MAGCLAVATAYLREFGRAERFSPDFSGPMAKPDRMAALTTGTGIAALWPFAPSDAVLLEIRSGSIAVGTALTLALRARRLLATMASR